MMESIINLVSSGSVGSHTSQTAGVAVLCAVMSGLFSSRSLGMPDAEKFVGQ